MVVSVLPLFLVIVLGSAVFFCRRGWSCGGGGGGGQWNLQWRKLNSGSSSDTHNLLLCSGHGGIVG